MGRKSTVHVVCKDKATKGTLIRMGAKAHLLGRAKFRFKYASEEKLAHILAALRDLSFCFVGGSGWPPAAVFEDLRKKGLIAGKFLEVIWARENNPMLSER